MKDLGYYNGKFGPLSEMQVPMNERSCYFGDGVYDATYSRNYVIYCLQEHIDRFYRSAALVGITVPYTKQELADLLYEMLRKMDTGDVFVYWQITRGTAPRHHEYDPEMRPNLWIILQPSGIDAYDETYTAITGEDTRFYHCNAKTLNLLPNVMAIQRAIQGGYDECILHRGERVTECTRANVHMLKDGVFHTPPTDELILPGIARANLIKACRALDIPVSEAPFTVSEMMAADDVFISSSGTFCAQVPAIDDVPVGGKDMAALKRLKDYLYHDFMEKTDRKE